MRTVGPSLALEPLTHRQNVARLTLFYGYFFGRCSSELPELVPFPNSQGRSTRYSGRLHHFSVTIHRCYKDAYVNSFFPRKAQLWNSQNKECFPLTYNLSGFKPTINRHLLTVGFFWIDLLYDLFFWVSFFFFFVPPYLAVAVQPCIKWIPIKSLLRIDRKPIDTNTNR